MAKKSTAKKNTLNPRVALVNSTATVRHLSLTVKYGTPICGEYGWHWTGSKDPKKHKMAICKKCLRVFENLAKALEGDALWRAAHMTPEEEEQQLAELVEKTTAEIEDLLADRGLTLDDVISED